MYTKFLFNIIFFDQSVFLILLQIVLLQLLIRLPLTDTNPIISPVLVSLSPSLYDLKVQTVWIISRNK